MLEAEVMREVAAYLKIKGYMIQRSNTGRRGGVSYGTVGSGDFTGLLPSGVYVAIECKGEGGKQSLDQEEFMYNVRANNGLYLLVYSVEDVIKGFDAWEKQTPNPKEDE